LSLELTLFLGYGFIGDLEMTEFDDIVAALLLFRELDGATELTLPLNWSFCTGFGAEKLEFRELSETTELALE
jgi:hypothetical protein